MKPYVDPGITAYRSKIAEGRSTLYKKTEVIYMIINYPDTHQIAKMKIMDELYRAYLMN